MSENEKTLVFVYGTLRKESSNHFRLRKAPFVKEGWILGRLYRIDWYPGMRLDEEGVPVRGEIYEIEREALRELDAFEGNEFERLKTKVHAIGGGDLHVWLYEYCKEVDFDAELLPADWVHHERKIGRKAPAPFFSLATFILLPATAALGAFMTWADPDSYSRFSWILQVLSIALPLLAFLAGIVFRCFHNLGRTLVGLFDQASRLLLGFTQFLS